MQYEQDVRNVDSKFAYIIYCLSSTNSDIVSPSPTHVANISRADDEGIAELYNSSIILTFNMVMLDYVLMDYEFEFPPINVSKFYINVYLIITAYVNLLYKLRHILHDSNIAVNLFIPTVCLIYAVPFLNFICQTSQILTDIFYIFNFWTLHPKYRIYYMNLTLLV